MKVIVFDLLCSQPVGKVKFHGGGEYTKTVFKFFTSHYKGNSNLVACYNKNKYIDDWIIKIIEENNILFEQVESSQNIVEILSKYDCYEEIRFFTGLAYGYKGLKFSNVIVKIGTCHGLRAIEKQTDQYLFLYYKSFGLFKEMAKKILSKVLYKKYYKTYQAIIKDFDIIITDSSHSAFSIRLNYPDIIKDKDIHVFYPLTQLTNLNMSLNEINNKKYIMVISADRWIKNSYRGVMAIDDLYEKGFLNGVKTKVYGNAPLKIRNKIKNYKNFQFYEYVTTDELELAYKNCEILFYPTLNEGFGNVPMEAMKYGKTCVISAVCSLPEVYGESAYYCNPYDIMEMQNRILQSLENKIPPDFIKQKLNYLSNRQNNDMTQLCNIIAGEKNRMAYEH